MHSSVPPPPPAPGRRRFRPRAWAALLTLAFMSLTVHLGNWQGGKADYKLAQQAQLDAARALPPVPLAELMAQPEPAVSARYRAVEVTGTLDPARLFYVDNRILDGRAGYDVLQVLRYQTVPGGAPHYALVDRGWVPAPPDRAVLPPLATPEGAQTLQARLNRPRSRNPGTFDNADPMQEPRINYVDLDELAAQLRLPLQPFVLEQTGGPGHLGTVRPPPASDFAKNRAYQVQWYAFALLALVLFVVLSFRRQDPAR